MLKTKKSPDPKIGRFLKLVKKKLLLQRLLNSNSHGNGHTDHGVVTCAQEASEAGLPVGKILKRK